MGRVSAPHGLRGELRVLPLTDFPERFHRRRSLWVEGEGEPRRVEWVRFHGDSLLVKLAGIDDREAAAGLRGRHLAVPAFELPPLPPGTYYHHQLLGLTAVTPDGRELGRVTDILRTGANDVYVVEPVGGGRARLIPALASVVTVDLARGIILVRPQPGLLDDADPADAGG